MNSRRAAGFTLVELAVAMIIIGLLLAAAFLPISTQVDLKAIADTQRTEDTVKDAILGFALTNGRLPCPADGSIAAGTSSAGLEDYNTISGNCNRAAGVVPWATLGVPETDAWSRRFSYRVSPAFGDAISRLTYYTAGSPTAFTLTSPTSPQDQAIPTGCSSPTPTPTPTQASFAVCSLGDSAVWTRNESTHAATVLASGLPVVIVSHGKNGYGAWQVTGQQMSAPTGSDENANYLGTTTVITNGYAQYAYYSRTRTADSSSCSDSSAGSPFCEFDDIVTFVPSTVLVSRMVSGGKLP